MSSEISPDQSHATLRRKLNNRLESIKVMLVHKRDHLAPDEWNDFVMRTRDSILSQPDQYLDKDLPSDEIWRSIITTLFDEFIAREKIIR